MLQGNKKNQHTREIDSLATYTQDISFPAPLYHYIIHISCNISIPMVKKCNSSARKCIPISSKCIYIYIFLFKTFFGHIYTPFIISYLVTSYMRISYLQIRSDSLHPSSMTIYSLEEVWKGGERKGGGGMKGIDRRIGRKGGQRKSGRIKGWKSRWLERKIFQNNV